MGTIGKAISLSGVTKLPRDDYGFYDRFKQIQERKKTQQPAYDPYKDFVKIDKTLQPAWANELSKLGSETIKKIQDARAKNPNNQAEIVRIMQDDYNPRASAIISGNTNALDYMAGAISKGYADPEVLRSIATSQNIEDIQKAILAAQDPSVNVSPTGSFFGNAGTRYNIGKDLDFGTEDYNQILPPNQRNLGERTEIISRLGLNPKVKEDRIKQIASNPTFQRKVFYDNPQLRGAINSGQAEQIFIDEATKLLGSVPSEKLGTPTYRENDKPSRGGFNFSIGGTGTNERFSVEKIAPKAIQYQTVSKNGDVVAQYETGNGYSIKGLTEAENAPQYWSSSTAFNVETGKQERAFNKKGTLVGVMDSFNVLDKSGKVLREIKDPIAIVQVKNETASGKEKDVTYFVPYKNVKGEVKAYTADKKGAGGWELPENKEEDIKISTKFKGVPKGGF